MKPPVRQRITVSISRVLADQFKAVAKRLYPKEAYAIALGHVVDGQHQVEWLFFPDVLGDHSDEYSVSVKKEWWDHAEELAKAKDMVVIGDIHSHPYDQPCEDHAPSESDWGRFDRNYVQGICVVGKYRTGKLKATIKFWGMPPAANMELT